jgi:hypothetical protein
MSRLTHQNTALAQAARGAQTGRETAQLGSPLKAVFFAIAVLATGIGGLVLALKLTLFTTTPMPLNRPVSVEIGKVMLVVPSDQMRVIEQRVGGVLSRLDLALDAETLTKPGSTARPKDSIFISIEASGEGTDPVNRTEELYSRFLTPEATPLESGLVKRVFRDRSPYNDEVLYVSAPDGRAFAARCGPVNARNIDAVCLWLVRHRGLDVQIRFDPSLLPRWEAIAAGVFDRLAAMRQADGGGVLP